jgi:23S rRNA G2069 N7-methylase RlmK/C1962 C5-methylase RlmI
MKILDATCGNRGIWFNKQQKDTIFIDIRPDCFPDRVMDLRKTDFPDKTFDLIIFDPPHDSDKKKTF